MADFVSEPRVWETSTTTGTGTLDLGGASAAEQGLRSFVGAGLDGKKVPYMIAHQSAAEWEFGIGTVTDAATDTLSRQKVFRSSNSNAAVNLSAGTKDVFLFDWPGLGGGAHHTITGATTLAVEHHTVYCNSASDFALTLPAVADFHGKEYRIRNINSGIVTITAQATENIVDPVNGAANTLKLYLARDSAVLYSEGGNWYADCHFRSHGAKLRREAAQSLNDATVTKIAFDAEIYDIGSIGDPVTNDRVDILRAGRYQITAWGRLANGGADTKVTQVRITKNAGPTILALQNAYSPTAAGTLTPFPSIVEQLSAGDYVEMYMFHDYGSAQNTYTTDLSVAPSLVVQELR